ncbi:hypothetical protein B0T10DRAFT_461691 [Thelonectria olida]|uniref:Apple domain-containing protein n=1 Tax=Thelonectria olida TaxID=1576542 RepID=A0A9P8W2X3_9HYPO|nr:hypothetical protein B0T10DRAFT_461691 [Thelonectria olida]
MKATGVLGFLILGLIGQGAACVAQRPPQNVVDAQLNKRALVFDENGKLVKETPASRNISMEDDLKGNEILSLNTATNQTVINPPRGLGLKEPLNATQLACLPPTARCNMPGYLDELSDFKPYATAHHNVKMPLRCAEFCGHPHNREWCKSFAHTRRDRRCTFYNFTVERGIEHKEHTGYRFWDIECWTCGISQNPAW